MKKYILILSLLITASSINASEYWQKIDFDNIDTTMIEQAITDEVNRIRKKHDLQSLKYSQCLYNAAKTHSNNMVKYGFFGHTNRHDSATMYYYQRIGDECGDYNYIGENCESNYLLNFKGRYYETIRKNGKTYYRNPITKIRYQPHTYRSFAKDVVKQWMDSKGHRENILHWRYRYMAIGIAISKSSIKRGFPKVKITQTFSYGERLVTSEELGESIKKAAERMKEREMKKQ